MEYKKITDLSFFSDEQKGWFDNYIIYEDGTVYNQKTCKEVAKTLHGSRGYVVNLSIYIDGKRRQRQIVVHRAVADLFIRPIADGEKLCFVDDNKENTHMSNLKYVLTKKKKMEEHGETVAKQKGITKEGRICTKCKVFKPWKEMASSKLSVCRKCASERGMNYQKSVNYSQQPVKFATYASRLKRDNPVDVNGFLGAACSICKKVFLLTRSKVLNRIKSFQKNNNSSPLVCPECKEKEK